jgi:NADPH:quinone reductase-like Zn-dependent oxidoreductase
VKAAGVGLWDRLMREGRISQALPLTLGSEVSGTVAALGAGVGVGVRARRRHIFEADKIAPKPAALDYIRAAGLPVVSVTAWQMLFEHARIELGQAVLVRGAAIVSAPARRRWR